jgi:hypothetical protein
VRERSRDAVDAAFVFALGFAAGVLTVVTLLVIMFVVMSG